MTNAAALVALLRPAVGDERVLEAIASIPRERFVPGSERDHAYANVALPIACGQTISQPLVIARMLDLLELAATDRVLDVGTGSGYHAAVLAALTEHVWTIERHAGLSELAAQTLGELGIDNVTVLVGDGSRGLPAHAPFDAINVAAAVGPSVPAELEDQLSPGGRIIAPVGVDEQRLMLGRRRHEGIERTTLDAVRFVPLVREG